MIHSEGEGRWIDYAGGYSDMLLQRGTAQEPAPPERAPERAPAKPRGMAKPAGDGRKISFKDRHALETLPARMASLESEIGRLRPALRMVPSTNAIRRGSGRTSEALATAETERAQAEEQWLELEILRESVDGR